MKPIIQCLCFLFLIFTVGCQNSETEDSVASEITVTPPAKPQSPSQTASPDPDDDGRDDDAPIGSAEQVAIPFAKIASLDASVLPEWPGTLDELNQFVQGTRGARVYPNPNPGNYLRRAPWYYGDGCYAKAAHISALAEKSGYPQPGKVLAFGGWASMRFISKYLPGGEIWWNYHVVSAYRIGSQVYALDPLIVPERALTVDEWVKVIAPNPGKISVAYCDQNLYAPKDQCIGGNSDGAYTGHINEMLKEEYRSLKNLGFNPDALL